MTYPIIFSYQCPFSFPSDCINEESVQIGNLLEYFSSLLDDWEYLRNMIFVVHESNQIQESQLS